MIRSAALSAFALFVPALAQAQALPVVNGERSRLFTAAEINALPHETVRVSFHGAAHIYEGVPLGRLLADVGAPSGESMRGKALTLALRASASDGYHVVLSLAETDPAMRRARVIVADREAGAPLSREVGPLRLVVEGDLKPARSVRQLARLEILDLATPK